MRKNRNRNNRIRKLLESMMWHGATVKEPVADQYAQHHDSARVSQMRAMLFNAALIDGPVIAYLGMYGQGDEQRF